MTTDRVPVTAADLRQHVRDANAQACRLMMELVGSKHPAATVARLVELVSDAVKSLRQAAELAERRRETP